MNISTHKKIREENFFLQNGDPLGIFLLPEEASVTIPAFNTSSAHRCTHIHFWEHHPWLCILGHPSTSENTPKRMTSGLALLTFLYHIGFQYLVSLG